MNDELEVFKIEGYCLFIGKHFSPLQVEKTTGLSFDEQNESGELGTTGRYKDSPLPYGSACINFSHPGTTPDLLPADINLINILSKYMTEIRAAGADEITLYVNVYYTAQCNIQLSPELLKILAGLNITIAISAINAEQEQ